MELRVAGGAWSVIARDGAGHERVASIAAPATGAEREDAAWLARRLLADLPRAPVDGGTSPQVGWTAALPAGPAPATAAPPAGRTTGSSPPSPSATTPTPPAGPGTPALEGTSPDQYLGHAVTGIGDEDGDGVADVLVGAPEDSSYGSSAGAAWMFHGPLSGTQSPADADATFYAGDARWNVGSALAGGADLSGDGWPDFAIGADGKTSGGSGSGSTFLLAGGGI